MSTNGLSVAGSPEAKLNRLKPDIGPGKPSTA
jgi:hypothetical protein